MTYLDQPHDTELDGLDHGGGGHGGGHGHGGRGGRGRGFGPSVLVADCTGVYAPVTGSDGRVYYNAGCIPPGIAIVNTVVSPALSGVPGLRDSSLLLPTDSTNESGILTGIANISTPFLIGIGIAFVGLLVLMLRPAFKHETAMAGAPLCDDPKFARKHRRVCG